MPSELSAVDSELMDTAIGIVTSLFRQHRFCMPVGYNLKRIVVSGVNAEGRATGGFMTWAIRLQPIEARLSLTAFVDVEWDGDTLRIPAAFRDHRDQTRGFSEVSLRRFLYAGADLSQHEIPIIPMR